MCQNRRQNWTVVQQGRAEVPAENVADPPHVLHVERLIKAKTMADNGDYFSGGVSTCEEQRRIPRCEMQEQKGHGGDPEEDRDQVEDPAQDVISHQTDSA